MREPPAYLRFNVLGNPVPKQSTRFDGNGHAHTDPRVKAWQNEVSLRARQAAAFAEWEITGQPLTVRLDFILPDRRARGCDNLSKCILDGCNKILWLDDKQVTDLHITKQIGDVPGVLVTVRIGGTE